MQQSDDNSQYTDLDYSGMHQFEDPNDPDLQSGSFEVFQGSDYYDPDLESDPDSDEFTEDGEIA